MEDNFIENASRTLQESILGRSRRSMIIPSEETRPPSVPKKKIAVYKGPVDKIQKLGNEIQYEVVSKSKVVGWLVITELGQHAFICSSNNKFSPSFNKRANVDPIGYNIIESYVVNNMRDFAEAEFAIIGTTGIYIECEKKKQNYIFTKESNDEDTFITVAAVEYDNFVSTNNMNTIMAGLRTMDNLSTLTSVLDLTKLDEYLSGDKGEYTLLAPSNEAFSKFPSDVLNELFMEENRNNLMNVLLYHVIPSIADYDYLKNANIKVKSLQGEELSVVGDGESITIDKTSSVITADIIRRNGVIHIIDTVLLPKDLNRDVKLPPPSNMFRSALELDVVNMKLRLGMAILNNEKIENSVESLNIIRDSIDRITNERLPKLLESKGEILLNTTDKYKKLVYGMQYNKIKNKDTKDMFEQIKEMNKDFDRSMILLSTIGISEQLDQLASKYKAISEQLRTILEEFGKNFV